MKIGQHPFITTLMTTARKERPPKPKYYTVWDVQTVLNYMNSLPSNDQLEITTLSHKLITLLGLCMVSRRGEVAEINTEWMSTFTDKIKCSTGTRPKVGKKDIEPLVFHSFPENLKLCPRDCLLTYKNRTEIHKETHKTTLLFLSVRKPYKPVTKSTLAKWVIKMLHLAGIDTSSYTAHSVRAASTSKAKALGISLNDILQMGDWTRESTWQKFYHKEVASVSKNFQETLLRGSTSESILEL